MMRERLSDSVVLVLAGCALCVAAGVAAAQNSGVRQGGPAAASQTTPPQPVINGETQGAAAADVENADVAITARVTARELLFRKVPNPRVEFTGQPRRETAWEADRQNLPEAVQPGVTYRDIGITLRITSVFADIDRIVAEALGEIPMSEDTPPQGEPPGRDAPPAPPSAPPVPTTQSPDGPGLNPTATHAVSDTPPAPTARRQSRPRRGRGK